MSNAPRKRRPDARDDDDGDVQNPRGGERDPLGKLYEQHKVNFAGVVAVCAVLAIFGIVALIYGLFRQPMSLLGIVSGLGVLLCSIAIVGVNAFNVGRHLELRKRGIRFTQSGIVTELLWKEIVDIEVKRTDDASLGVVNIRKRSSNASAPTGLLSKTEWDVTIHADDGRTIRLPPMFLRTVRDPKKLISQMRLRAGI
jgi:hypothetical protein